MQLTVWLLLAAGLLEALTTKLERTVFLTGSFIQTDTRALTRETETIRGAMSLAHPNLFRLDYTDPGGRVTGCDGAAVYTVEPLYREVFVYEGANSEGFLHLLRRAGDEGMTAVEERTGDMVSVTIQGDAGDGISVMEVVFSLSDSLPRFFRTSDVNGNRTEYALSGLDARSAIPGGHFTMRVPDGYTVVTGEH